jgi:hypothetical protein
MRWRLLILTCLLLCVPGVSAAQSRQYTIALGFPFPPWDVGPLEGVNYDLLTAICSANTAMRCRIIDRPTSECVDSDAAGHPVIGSGLTLGRFDACMGWFDTPQRKQLGAEFADAHSLGPVPQLIARDSNPIFDNLDEGDDLGGAAVGFLSGLFHNPDCLGNHYENFTPHVFSADQSGRDAMIAALLNGTIDLAFWESVATVPAGTHVVGVPVHDCGPELSTIVFPPRKAAKHKADEFRRDFNCGLALIRQNGVMASICASSTHPGGDPHCILDGPAPTVQCLADNAR